MRAEPCGSGYSSAKYSCSGYASGSGSAVTQAQSIAASQAGSDDLNSSFRHAMLRQMGAGGGTPRRKSAAACVDARKGTAPSQPAGGRGGAAWGREVKHAETNEACSHGDGEIGAAHRAAGGATVSGDVLVPSLGSSSIVQVEEPAGRVDPLPHSDAPDAGSDGTAGADNAAGSACGATSKDVAEGRAGRAPGMPAAAVAKQWESREEGRVLHTFVADSQESLKSLRTLLTHSREGLHAGAPSAGLLRHARVSDHGDARPLIGSGLAPPPQQPWHAGAAGDAAPGGPLQPVWSAATVGAQGDGAIASQESSPAVSLVAMPGREVHTGQADMLILQRQETGNSSFHPPMGYGHTRGGTLRVAFASALCCPVLTWHMVRRIT